MATVVVEATEPEPSGSIGNPAASTSPSLSHRFLDSKFYLLVVVGETVTEEHLRRAIGNIELGIRSWDTNLIECNLDQELKLFVSRHSARFSPEVPGQKILHHRSDVLETVVLINPSPRHPDVSMVDPDALAVDQNLGKALKKDLKEKTKTKKPGTKTKSSSPVKKGDGKSKPLAASPKPGALKESSDKVSRVASPKKKESVEKATKTTTTPEVKATRGEEKDKETKNAANASASKSAKTATAGPGTTKTAKSSTVPPGLPVYLDLCYIPNHSNSKNVDVEFFKRVRSSYYVVSGNDPAAEEPSRAVLDALLEGKAQWGSNMQVTLIPTHDSEVMREWYQETHEKQQDLNIMVLASSSTVVMQDESFPACKIEL